MWGCILLVIFHVCSLCTSHKQCDRAQVSHSDGYWTHPALLDAATHFGAVVDTDASCAGRRACRCASASRAGGLRSRHSPSSAAGATVRHACPVCETGYVMLLSHAVLTSLGHALHRCGVVMSVLGGTSPCCYMNRCVPSWKTGHRLMSSHVTRRGRSASSIVISTMVTADQWRF